jgi:hypothetical protein
VYTQVKHLSFLETKRGTKLLTSGWWGAARKINYTGTMHSGWIIDHTCYIIFPGQFFFFLKKPFVFASFIIYSVSFDFTFFVSFDLGLLLNVGDWLVTFSWCLLCGFDSPIPYFQAIYFLILLIHR